MFVASDTDAKRQNVVQEFIDTEQSYRNDLRNVVEVNSNMYYTYEIL